MIIAWFSCGATSAVACKIALSLYDDVHIYYIETGSGHPDNTRFLAERHEAMSKAAKATMHEGYNNKNIPVSAYYNVNSTGRFGSRYVGD